MRRIGINVEVLGADPQRVAGDRRGLRYLNDLTDAEWALAEPLIVGQARPDREL
jgi:hypothetical protein